MKVKIMQRSVYHKYAEIEVEVPDLIDGDFHETHEWLMENEDLWSEDMDSTLSKAKYRFGNGISLDDAWTDWSEESEWRYEFPNGNGGHL